MYKGCYRLEFIQLSLHGKVLEKLEVIFQKKMTGEDPYTPIFTEN